MRFTETKLKGAFVIEVEPFKDNRGEFGRLFCKKELESIKHTKDLVQINLSKTAPKGSLRGMHFQHPPKAETKIVKCVKGRIFDAIVDIRKDSATFLQWFGVELSDDNNKILYIPEGFAHGFQTLKDNSALIYFTTEFYSPEHEGGLRFDDPAIGISWPLPAEEMSEKDRKHPLVDDAFKGIVL